MTAVPEDLRRARAHYVAERHREAVDAYAPLLDAHTLTLEQEVDARLDMSNSCRLLGECDRMHDVLEPLRPLVPRLDPERAARTEMMFGVWAHYVSRFDESIAYLRAGEAHIVATHHHHMLSAIYCFLGYSLRSKGEHAEALAAFRDAVSAARRSDRTDQLARALGGLARALSMEPGASDEAIRLHREHLELADQQPSKLTRAVARLSLAQALSPAGEWREAEELFKDAHERFAALDDPFGQILSVIGRVQLMRVTGRYDEALTLIHSRQNLAEETSAHAELLGEHGDIARHTEDHETAMSRYRRAWKIALSDKAGNYMSTLGWKLGVTYLALGRFEEAERMLTMRFGPPDPWPGRLDTGRAMLGLADLRSIHGDSAEALALCRQAREVFLRAGVRYGLAIAYEAEARVLLREDAKSQRAVARLEDARSIYAELGASPGIERVSRISTRARNLSAHVSASTNGDRAPANGLIVADPAMKETLDTAARLAANDAPVVILGETGSGKEVIARVIHEEGPRAERPFVALNCAALPDSLLDSELFGHAKGVFTGATTDTAGLFMAAKDGTILLDEIDKASYELQTKLLRAVDSGTVRRIGDARERPFSARLLAASNRDLRTLAATDAFLPDLYYRLAGIEIVVPPLRERPADIDALAESFLCEWKRRAGVSNLRFSEHAMATLRAYGWPGNVRELRNVVTTAAFHAHGVDIIDVAHLPSVVTGAGSSASAQSLREQVDAFERDRIRVALENANGVKTRAAEELGISRKGLLDKLRRLGLQEDASETRH